MSIRFSTRKYGHCIDASFYLVDGDSIIQSSDWHVGDGVHVMFDATEEMHRACIEMDREGFAVYNGKAHIPCKVVSRSHSIAWVKVGSFQTLGLSIVLEAEDGWWEDLLIWIVKGTRPVWARNPGEELQ